MENKVNIGVQDGIPFLEFKAHMEGFAAGVAAACDRAVQIRIAQLSKQPAAPEPPKE